MEKSFEGRIWKLGDDIDTDIIMPTQWVTLDTMDEVKKHAFEPLRPELAAQGQLHDHARRRAGGHREKSGRQLGYEERLVPG